MWDGRSAVALLLLLLIFSLLNQQNLLWPDDGGGKDAAPGSHWDDESCGMDGGPQSSDSTPHQLTLTVDPIFYKFLIGKAAATKTKLQRETGTIISIPKPGDPSHEIVIRGTAGGVESARARIELLIQSAKAGGAVPYTHFIGLPLHNNTALTAAFHSFKSAAIEQCDGLDERIFVAGHLHLTLIMLKLYGDEDLQKCIKILRDNAAAVYDILKTRCLVVRVSGLEIMNDDPKATEVLYGKIADSPAKHAINAIHDLLMKAFIDADLAPPTPDRNLKLHMTLMNSKLLNSDSTPGAPQHQQRQQPQRQPQHPQRKTFDATKVLQLFGSMDFGEHRIEALHLSTRGQHDESGYYLPAHVMPLP
eukprot:gnl/Hemi2/3749_TR1307_c0_g1_i1.p1 gnl/Hemi2/3749_TR1307_c0_g1~~gnl/Hemi2/3749_TR1307_c0_g1_i1.p1  ORF type:complete len:362 (-),score=61.13 gnl/Hemi2/3749_TR1307_c0_g1_i1:109-1194(-)